MRMKLAVLSMLLSATAAVAAPPADFPKQILAAHNKERAAVDVPPLVWNDTLAADAKPWAEHLAQLGDMQHADADTRNGAGENLWMGTAGAYDVPQMVGAWAGEKAFFVPGVFPDGVSANVNGNWHMIAHYTQIVWRNTTDVGCAMATGHGYDFLVCRYSPAGNFVGQKVY
jgi:Cysteine-rich secretory protein family